MPIRTSFGWGCELTESKHTPLRPSLLATLLNLLPNANLGTRRSRNFANQASSVTHRAQIAYACSGTAEASILSCTSPKTYLSMTSLTRVQFSSDQVARPARLAQYCPSSILATSSGRAEQRWLNNIRHTPHTQHSNLRPP